MPSDAMAGSKHVIGVIPLGVDSNEAKDNPDSLLLRCEDQQQVCHAVLPFCFVVTHDTDRANRNQRMQYQGSLCCYAMNT